MKKESLDELYAELNEAYTHWENLYKNGGSDPFWADGCNLNLSRNHIIYYKKQIDENYSEAPKRATYLHELPPKVAQNYMAQPDVIREQARESLRVMKANKDYNYLREHLPRLRPEQAKKMSIGNVIGYVAALEDAIATDNLVTQRRYRNPDMYVESFRSTAQEVRALKPPEQEQLCMFYQSSFEEETEEPKDEEQGWNMQL